MLLSVATANLYFQPFEQTLEIIAKAGFQNIELDMFYAGKEWAMAQHLRDVPIKRVVRMVERSGLRISSIHDGSGVLDTEHSLSGFINPALDLYISEMGYAPECLVFHTPTIEGNPGNGWWERISGELADSLERFRKIFSFVTIENLPLIDGYFVPLITPEELKAYVVENSLGATIDTTHYAQMGVDILEAARILGRNIKTIHLSDFKADRTHVFIGDGELNLSGFFDSLDKESVNAITLECSLSATDRSSQEMSYEELVSRMKEARLRLESLL